jgi:hypothetical protein
LRSLALPGALIEALEAKPPDTLFHEVAVYVTHLLMQVIGEEPMFDRPAREAETVKTHLHNLRS